MTSQGHAYARLQRALKTGNAHIALAAAAELRQVDLADALSLLLLIREDEPILYDKAAVRWFARYAAEDRYLLPPRRARADRPARRRRPVRPGRRRPLAAGSKGSCNYQPPTGDEGDATRGWSYCVSSTAVAPPGRPV
jgi:hypothetical protein